MQADSSRNEIDVAFLPIGDNFTMGPEDVPYAVELLKLPKRLCQLTTKYSR